jgi:hypothetical protein
MKYKDGIPLEWRITWFYICAATVLTMVIMASDYSNAAKVAAEMNGMQDKITEHNEQTCNALGYYK